MIPRTPLTALALASLALSSAAAPQMFAEDQPLPRWREGGTPPYNPDQSLHPYAIQLPKPKSAADGPPTSGTIISPPEYAPTDGVLFRYHSGSWVAVVKGTVAALTSDPTKDDIAYVVVKSPAIEAEATTKFINAGADMSKVVFIHQNTDSIWMRDYGPHFVWQDDALTITDGHYYPTRPNDNFVPTLIAEEDFVVPAYPQGLYYSGGNFQVGPNNSAFVTSLINDDNPDLAAGDFEQLYEAFQGIETLHIVPRLPGWVDGTGHIDMWFYMIDEDTVMISEFLPGEDPTAIAVTNNAVPYMEALGFTVHRMPAWNDGSIHYTYANAFRVNDRIFIPSYGQGDPAFLDEDATALAAWEAAAPDLEIVTINCYSIIPAAGAIHCIVKQVPKYTDPVPAAHVVSPDGSEVLVSGTTRELTWAATDDEAVSSVDLYYSTDGGATYPHLIASGEPDDGSYDWTIPALSSSSAKVKVVAHDAALNNDESESYTDFTMGGYPQTTYDFGSGAGVDKWGWGSETGNFGELDGTRIPAGLVEIDTLKVDAYTDIATSDATGNDTDPNRYIAPVPSTGTKETTHVFEFVIDEDPDELLDIEIIWEGYNDDCNQVELYVWDDTEGNWGDLKGNFGKNRYAANFAGNKDETLTVHIQQDFDRYLTVDGRLTFLVYADRDDVDESFHDYVAVTTTYKYCQTDMGFSGPGSVSMSLCGDVLTQEGAQATLSLGGAAPFAPVIMFAGFDANPIPIEGGTLVPVPWAVVDFSLATDGSGSVSVPLNGRAGTPTSVYFQAIVPNGFTYEFSNAIDAVFGL